MSTSKITPIIYNLNEKDIDIIRNDLRLYYSGCEIIYFVDPFDVIEFANPSQFESSPDAFFNDDTNSQRYLSYHSFFLKNASTPILVEEYRQELYSLFDEFTEETRKYYQLRRKDDFVNYFLTLAKDPKQLERKMSIFLIYSIGVLDLKDRKSVV